jgi:hypothetical protein
MSREVQLARGGTAAILSADAERVSLEVPHAAPPGSTVELLVSERKVGIKVQSCRRSSLEPLRYRIEGRWISLSRIDREALGIAAPPTA